jgi:hypothetical protein
MNVTTRLLENESVHARILVRAQCTKSTRILAHILYINREVSKE